MSGLFCGDVRGFLDSRMGTTQGGGEKVLATETVCRIWCVGDVEHGRGQDLAADVIAQDAVRDFDAVFVGDEQEMMRWAEF